MSETSEIAEIARVVAKDIFGVFGWQSVGPKDHDFDCVSQEAHERRTHPSDIVFWYDDPYENQKIFLNTDLKSWKAATFSKAKVRGELTSLCQATECANVSRSWGELYGDSNSRYKVHGLLFLFNHDRAYDGILARILGDYDAECFGLPKSSRVFVFTPNTIVYLAAVANDIVNSRGRGELPQNDGARFYYPDLVDVHPKSNERHVATAEVLCSPWQVLRYITPPASPTGRAQVGYLVYYRGKGATEDEFKYLIDYFFRYQLLGDDETICVRMPYADDNAAAIFARAKDGYADEFYGLQEFRQRLNRITFKRIPVVTLDLKPTDGGMTDG